MKRCSKCKEHKPLDQFAGRARSKDGLQHYCRSCMKRVMRDHRAKHPHSTRRSNLNANYGPGAADWYDEQYEAQEGKCALCGEAKPNHGQDGLHLDHCHSTGRRRALLCSRCNSLVGRIESNPALTEAAMLYVKAGGDELHSWLRASRA